MGGFEGRGGCLDCGCRSLEGRGRGRFGPFACTTSTGLAAASDFGAAGTSIPGAAAFGFFRGRGRRGGLGTVAFIERLIRFIAESTPITFTFTMSPTFTA